MHKLLIALAAITVGLPSVAGTVHDFDPSNVRPAKTLDGQCYTTMGDSTVCFFRVSGETYNVAVNMADDPEFPQVFTIDCDTGRFKGFGPMTNQQNSAFAEAFCNSGRY